MVMQMPECKRGRGDVRHGDGTCVATIWRRSCLSYVTHRISSTGVNGQEIQPNGVSVDRNVVGPAAAAQDGSQRRAGRASSPYAA